MEKEWIECCGCGAQNPNERCIGCLHYFGERSWDTRKIYDNGVVDSFEADEKKIYRIACIVADGYTEGNEQYEDMTDMMKLRMIFAAENILRHFSLNPKYPDKMPEFGD